MFDREHFKDTLKCQLIDDIRMIIYECRYDYKTHMNVDLFIEKMSLLKTYALNDGLSPSEWEDLVYVACYEVSDQIDIVQSSMAA
jgi:hypothetical protein